MLGERKYPSFADPLPPVVTSAGAAAPITQVGSTPGIRPQSALDLRGWESNCARLTPSATNMGFCDSQLLTATVGLFSAQALRWRLALGAHPIYRDHANFCPARFRERHFRSGQFLSAPSVSILEYGIKLAGF